VAPVNDLLDLSKLGDGRSPLAREAVSLAEVARVSSDLVGPQAREKGVTVTLEVPAEVELSADRRKLEQVAANLLANAVKFTPAGGEVMVRGGMEAGRVVLRVRDTGGASRRSTPSGSSSPSSRPRGRGRRPPGASARGARGEPDWASPSAGRS
jgi:K+-sensing histidine kinase KdpD